MAEPTQTWLTQEAYDRLQAELDHLTGFGRRDIALRNRRIKSLSGMSGVAVHRVFQSTIGIDDFGVLSRLQRDMKLSARFRLLHLRLRFGNLLSSIL